MRVLWGQLGTVHGQQALARNCHRCQVWCTVVVDSSGLQKADTNINGCWQPIFSVSKCLDAKIIYDKPKNKLTSKWKTIFCVFPKCSLTRFKQRVCNWEVAGWIPRLTGDKTVIVSGQLPGVKVRKGGCSCKREPGSQGHLLNKSSELNNKICGFSIQNMFYDLTPLSAWYCLFVPFITVTTHGWKINK